MIFSISSHDDERLPYHKKINDQLSFHSLEPIRDQIIGWKFPPLGGNFIELIDIDTVMKFSFSFYKDFDLYADPTKNVLISNDPRYQGTPLDNDIIGLDINKNNYRMHRMNWKPYLNPTIESDQSGIIANLKKRLLHNLEICADIAVSPVKIVYTGGLDSSLSAFLFHQTGKSFKCIINEDCKNFWSDLPFQSISYRKSGIRNDRWGSQEHIKKSFYDSDLTDCITGFFGDTAMLHNNDLYHQCLDLMEYKIQELYDKSLPIFYTKFVRRDQAYASIIKMMKITRFQQWFEDFRILDPYRDPELTLIILKLPWKDISSQFGSAWVQKEMIRQIDPYFTQLILKHKNEYSCHE